MSIEELKKIGEQRITKQSGVKCSRSIFLAESNKRFKSIEDILEEKTLCEAKLRTKIRDCLRKQMQVFKLKEIVEIVRTKKVSSELVDSEVLEIINQEIDNLMKVNPPSN